MIVVRMKGGLGNQMFEYAMARRFQIDLCIDKIGLDLTYVNKDRLRNYSLHCFELSNQVEVMKSKKKITQFQELLARKLVSYLIAGRKEEIAGRREDLLAGIFALFGIIQRDHSIVNKKSLLRLHKNIYMNGWFQVAEMLLPIRDTLLQDFTWKSTRLLDSSIYRQISTSNAVCVHIRKGDYVNHPLYDVCGDIYYYRAMEYLAKTLKDPVFFVFSDSIDQVEKSMHFSYPVVFVHGEHQDYEDLFLMKHCRHFIMSNSTYSWWAQFLGEAEDKVVVAPKKWCLMEDMAIGVYMKEWVLMDTI